MPSTERVPVNYRGGGGREHGAKSCCESELSTAVCRELYIPAASPCCDHEARGLVTEQALGKINVVWSDAPAARGGRAGKPSTCTRMGAV